MHRQCCGERAATVLSLGPPDQHEASSTWISVDPVERLHIWTVFPVPGFELFIGGLGAGHGLIDKRLAARDGNRTNAECAKEFTTGKGQLPFFAHRFVLLFATVRRVA
jgi:hypothetical protein